MAIKNFLTRNFFWRLAFWLVLLTCLALGVLLWLSGAHDTKEALSDGRRLLITLENSAIEGKQISLEPTEAEKEAPAANETASVAATEPTAKATSPASATENASPESAKPAPEPAKAPPAATEPAVTAPQSSISPKAEQAPLSPPPLVALANIKPSANPPAVANAALLEKADGGNLPTISPSGQKPWQYYAKPYVHKGHLPMIAIIVTGLGQNKVVTEGALRLPENVSLSFSPYGHEVVNWAQAARTSGHEILVDLPLEPSNYPATDPGPYGLLVGKGATENLKRLKWLMSRLEGYSGFMLPLNEVFSANDVAFRETLIQLDTRGLMIGIPHEPAKDESKKILESGKIPYVIADNVIDEELSGTAIQARLLALQEIAGKRGFAVGIAQAYPLTIQQLSQWSKDLEKNGYTLVPVTFITKIKFPAG